MGVPFTPPLSLKYFSAILAPATSSCPSKATLLVCARPMPISIPAAPVDDALDALDADGELPGAVDDGVGPGFGLQAAIAIASVVTASETRAVALVDIVLIRCFMS